MFPASRSLIIGIATVLILACVGCGPGTDGAVADAPHGAADGSAAAPTYRDISVAELRSMMTEADPFLVNTHIPFQGDLPGTDVSIRFDRITRHLDRLPRDKDADIVLYCRSGRMSAEAGAVLARLGYTNVSNLRGGFLAWESAGFEILMTPSGD